MSRMIIVPAYATHVFPLISGQETSNLKMRYRTYGWITHAQLKIKMLVF